MGDDMTTLMVPKEFATKLRQGFEGGNDLERLKNWRDDTSEESYKNPITKDEVRSVLQEELSDFKEGMY